MNRRLLILLVVAAVIIGGGVYLVGRVQNARAVEYSADVVVALSGGSTEGFAKATTVKPMEFPAEHGPHPDFQTEWWYFTGNLADAAGERFGFQLAIFRRALSPAIDPRGSAWATNQVYFADFALTNVGGREFFSQNRFSRGAAGLAGATLEPVYRVWIEDWEILGLDPQADRMQLKASTPDYAIDLIAEVIKPITLQGDRGLSAKSPEPGNASYYYSITRMPTTGTMTVRGRQYTVTGNSWMDHEFSTSVLSEDATGWDWFSIQLDDGRDIMLYQIRKRDGTIEVTSDGNIIQADGSTYHLTKDEYTITPRGSWQSPRTGTIYPSGWDLVIRAPSGEIRMTVEPMLQDQELNSVTAYWEGASRVAGTEYGQPLTGYAYVELTGYNTESGTTNDSPGLSRGTAGE